MLIIIPQKFEKKFHKIMKDAEFEMFGLGLPNSPLEEIKKGFVYFLKSGNFYKIGRTKTKKRIGTYRTENPHEVKLLALKETQDCVKLEKELLKKYAYAQHRGEWFKFTTKEVEQITKILS